MNSNNKKIAVIGSGSWATALVYSLSRCKNRVWWWIRRDDVAEAIKKTKHNPKYLQDLELNLNNITISTNLQETIDNNDIVIIAIPVQYIPETLTGIDLSDKVIINASKGMTSSPPLLVSEYLEKKCGVGIEQYAVLSGPSHAEEISTNKTTYLTIASVNLELLRVIKLTFESIQISNLVFRTSYDVKGIELAGVLKNIYAIGMGLIAKEGENFKAAYLSSCSAEMNNIINTFYPYRDRCIFSSPYLGDLMVTGYSSLSRNYRFGELLANGNTVKESLAKVGQEVAGVTSLKNFIERYDESISPEQYPILFLLYRTIRGYMFPEKFPYHLQRLIK